MSLALHTCWVKTKALVRVLHSGSQFTESTDHTALRKSGLPASHPCELHCREMVRRGDGP